MPLWLRWFNIWGVVPSDDMIVTNAELMMALVWA